MASYLAAIVCALLVAGVQIRGCNSLRFCDAINYISVCAEEGRCCSTGLYRPGTCPTQAPNNRDTMVKCLFDDDCIGNTMKCCHQDKFCWFKFIGKYDLCEFCKGDQFPRYRGALTACHICNQPGALRIGPDNEIEMCGSDPRIEYSGVCVIPQRYGK